MHMVANTRVQSTGATRRRLTRILGGPREPYNDGAKALVPGPMADRVRAPRPGAEVASRLRKPLWTNHEADVASTDLDLAFEHA